MKPDPILPQQLHVRDNTVTVECSSPRAAVELAERLLHAKPVAYVTLEALGRLLASDTAVTQATGRGVATEASIGLFLGPQAGARKQAFEECLAICAACANGFVSDVNPMRSREASDACIAVEDAIRNRMEGKQ